MIDELPWQFKTCAQASGQRFHTERFGGVMTRVKEVDADFFSERVTPMRSLAGDECVDPFGVCLRDFAAGAPRHDADVTRPCRTTRANMRFRAESTCESPRKLLTGHLRNRAHSERLPFPHEERLAFREAKRAAELRGVADRWMDIERQMRAVNGEIVFEGDF